MIREVCAQLRIWVIVPFLMILAIFYVGKRGQQAFAKYIPKAYIKIYWLVYLLITSSFLIGRGFESGNPVIDRLIMWVGAYSLALLFYGFIILVLLDLFRIMDHWLGFIPKRIKQSPAKVGIAVILVLTGILAYGSWNAWHPVFTSYEIGIPKTTNNIEQLHVIMISDLHLGDIVYKERFAEMIQQINRQNPDIILLGGDIIDGDIEPFLEQDIGATFSQLKSRLGTYMVLGNHDEYGIEAVPYFKAAGITVLSDKYELIDNSFYLVGTDFGGWHSNGSSQQPLADIMAGINKQLPIILLKHSPVDL
ncbi:MAG: metallophosphoesterase, partial [Syntrophomonadaceae bacterium]|nr:metallophosphoesterase [Syntrophomonadaceae bacterium]